jgi:succinate dehydrogenase/fumarate reductase iron-sulfur protein
VAQAKSFEVHIRRYDPDREPTAYTQSYEVEYHPSMTVLEVLEEIQGYQDDSLAFRSSCRTGKCGSCAISLNGRPALACRTMVDGEDIQLEPLSNFPVVKDLIVDRERSQIERVRAIGRAQEIEPAEPLQGVALTSFPDFEDIYADLSRCIGCLVCEASCPVITAQVGRPFDKLRTRMERAAGETFPGPSFGTTAFGSGVRLAEEIAGQSYRCLLCGACTVACSSSVTTDHIQQLTRNGLAEQGLLPRPLAELDDRVAQAHNISGDPNENRLMWADNLPNPPSGLGKETAEVIYFVGCVSSLFPRTYSVAQSFVQIMEQGEVDYGLLGEDEWCCGYPMAINGEWARAREMMRHSVDAVRAREPKTLVTACPSCYHLWKHIYPEALGEKADRRHPLGFEVRHATEFLADLLEAGRLPLQDSSPRQQVVTYHDPCDLGRKSGVYEAPRRILAQLPGVTLVEMEENREGSHCCGGGGNLETFDPDLSQAVAARRIRQAANTGAEMVVSACQQCERTLFGAARAERIRIRVKDITEMVLEGM